MRLHLFIYKCQSCGREFKEPELPDGTYGVFLVRSESGERGLLRAIERPEFEEVDNLLANHPRLASIDRSQRADVLHRVFGVACDPAPDGTCYAVNRDPVCPNCHGARMISWEATEPPEYVFEDVAEVTHNAWHSLNDADKRNSLEAALAEAGY
jgi:hypothetical protein